MESDETNINENSDNAGDDSQRPEPLHGRTSGPLKRSKSQWTEEEDAILRDAVQRFNGKSWKAIAQCLPDRTDIQCMNRWKKVLNPDVVKGLWSNEEDEMLIEMVNKYEQKWTTVAQHFPGRNGKQCRERWCNHLDPNINKAAWTVEEELVLIQKHKVCGNKWADLAKFLPGRTDNAIKNYWNNTMKTKSKSQGLPHISQQNSSKLTSTGESALIPCSGDPVLQDDAFAEPEAQCGLDENFPELDISKECEAFAGMDCPIDIVKETGLSSLDLCPSQVNEFEQSISSNIKDGVGSSYKVDSNAIRKSGRLIPPSHIIDENEESEALFSEPHRSPSSDSPFYVCDLVPFGSEWPQEYSPLGIRQLMSTSMTSRTLWDSPSGDNSAAQTFSGTLSLLKKRLWDSVSPLSRKREEKLEAFSEQETLSNPSNQISRTNKLVAQLFPDNKSSTEVPCLGEDSEEPAHRQVRKESDDGNNVPQNKDSVNSSEQALVAEDTSKNASDEEAETARETSGVLFEPDITDLLLFSPEDFGNKSSRPVVGLWARALGYSCAKRSDDESLSRIEDGNDTANTKSLESLSSSEKNADSSETAVAFENKSISLCTPIKTSLDSPSAWKSPSSFDTDNDKTITLKDFACFMSPVDRSCDAIDLMKQLGEQTARTSADALEVLENDTPETSMKGKCSNLADENENYTNVSAVNSVHERRCTLDFSECGTPAKKKLDKYHLAAQDPLIC